MAKFDGNTRPVQKDPGSLVAIYHGRQLGLTDLLTLILPGALSVLAPLGYGIWRSSYAYARYGPVAAEEWSRPWFLLATLALFIFLFLGIYRLRLAHQFVAVYKHGLHINLQTSSLQFSHRLYFLRWEQIEGIATNAVEERFFNIPIRTILTAILYPSASRPVSLPTSLQNLPELISCIKAYLYPRLLPGLSANFQAGQWLYFGPIGVQSRAIRLGRAPFKGRSQSISWEQVDQLTVHSGFLQVKLKSQGSQYAHHQIPISKIPNLEILLQLVQQGVKL